MHASLDRFSAEGITEWWRPGRMERLDGDDALNRLNRQYEQTLELMALATDAILDAFIAETKEQEDQP